MIELDVDALEEEVTFEYFHGYGIARCCGKEYIFTCYTTKDQIDLFAKIARMSRKQK